MDETTRSVYERVFGKQENEDDFEEVPLEPASADDIIDPFENGEVLTLPGIGKPVRLRPITPAVMATRVGKIPNPYENEVIRLLAITEDKVDRMPEAKQIQHYKDNAIAYQYAAALMIMEPPFVMPPKDAGPDWRPPKGSIGPMHLKERDYIFLVYTYMQGGAEALLPFRKPKRIPRGARSGEGVRREAELLPRASEEEQAA